MSFFDRFKRSAQKDPETEKFTRAQKAVREFMPMLKAKYIAPDKSLHAGTMLSASAWLAGTSLYRSFGFTHTDPPGTLIKADEINKQWESLLFMLEGYLFGKADIPVGQLMMAALAAPAFFKPQVDMLRVQTDLQDAYNAVMQKQGFDYLDGARAGIVLCCAFIQQYDGAKIIDKTASSGIVAQAILEAAKTVPPSLRSSRS